MKKALSLILALIMIASMTAVVAMPASAADATATIASDVWDGTADKTWFDEADIKDEYVLTTAEQLAGLAEIVNNNSTMAKPFDGVTIKLGADIILNEGIFTASAEGLPLYNGESAVTNTAIKKWPVIGTRPSGNNTQNAGKTHFHGNIDGQDHVISGIFTYDTGCYSSFISVFGGEYIKNLSIVNSYLACETRTGVFTGFAGNTDTKDVTFENLYTNAYVRLYKGDGDTRSGGIFGMARKVNNIVASKLWFDGVLHATAEDATKNTNHTGGITSVICEENDNETITFDSCLVTGTIKTSIPADADNVTTAGLMSNLYTNNKKVTLEVKNCLVAPEEYVINGAVEKTKVSAFVARLEKSYVDYTLTNSYFVTTGAIVDGGVASSIAGVETEGTWTAGSKFNGTLLATANAYVSSDAALKIGDPTKATGLSADVFALTETSAAIKGLRTCLADHVYGDLIAEVPATCDAEGVKAHYECGICHKLFDEAKAEVSEADLTIAAAHKYGDLVAAVAPTLDNAGVLEHYECSECHKYFDKDKNEIASIEGAPKLTTTAAAEEDDKPAATTTKKAEEKGCGGFTAIGAVLALVALTGAAVVIKKK